MEGKERHCKEGFIITPLIFSSVAHDGEHFSEGLHSHGVVLVISFTSRSYESYFQEENNGFFLKILILSTVPFSKAFFVPSAISDP